MMRDGLLAGMGAVHLLWRAQRAVPLGGHSTLCRLLDDKLRVAVLAIESVFDHAIQQHTGHLANALFDADTRFETESLADLGE